MYHGNKIPGFPHHPHRGFETITIVEEGFADHFDSLGATGRFGNGDVQWMTAGKGVQHSEMFPLLDQNKPNPLELFQIWLNLPKRNKMVDPEYKMLWNEEIPVIESKDKNGKSVSVKIISGDYNEVKGLDSTKNSWAFDEDNQVQIWNISIEEDGTWELPESSDTVNKAIYFYDGESILIEGRQLPVKHSIKLKPNESYTISAKGKGAKILLLQGQPINEPVAQHGPFVMNTQEEIMEAFAEYRRTNFGGWPWEGVELTHPNTTKRFAKFPDGNTISPE